jgi:hypothetical protein
MAMEKNTRLLLSNVAVECSEGYLRQWIEARGYSVLAVRLIQDLVSGTSPSFAYVQLEDGNKLDEVARVLHGSILLGRQIRVCQVVPLQSSINPARNLAASA